MRARSTWYGAFGLLAEPGKHKQHDTNRSRFPFGFFLLLATLRTVEAASRLEAITTSNKKLHHSTHVLFLFLQALCLSVWLSTLFCHRGFEIFTISTVDS